MFGVTTYLCNLQKIGIGVATIFWPVKHEQYWHPAVYEVLGLFALTIPEMDSGVPLKGKNLC